MERLTEFARWFLADSNRKSDLVLPVLLWHAPASALEGPGLLDPTGPRLAIAKPTPSEPLVLPLTKRTGRPNAFAMGITLGRAETNDLSVNDASISRFHAFFREDTTHHGQWRLVDAESKNGTWVGPMKLTPNAAVELGNVVRLRFGSVELLYLTPASFFAYLDGMLRADAKSARRTLRGVPTFEMRREPTTDPASLVW